MVEDSVRPPRQEDPEMAVFDIEEDEDPGLAAVVPDFKVGLVARPGFRGQGQLGGDAGERLPKATLDAGEDLSGLHGGWRFLPALAGQDGSGGEAAHPGGSRHGGTLLLSKMEV
jgi:hypothetical protein